MDLAPGRRIDRYEVAAFLGRGGMAAVYLVRHATLHTLHALKVLTEYRGDHVDRLIREAQLQASLSHPNVVPVTDVIDVYGVPAAVMPFVRGPSLHTLLKSYRTDEDEVAAVFLAVCAGVACAHERGVVHRDLKPANILLDTTDHLVPRLADFGIAKPLGADLLNLTRPRTALGTPAFMAPEQLDDASAADERADVFSLGVVLYTMLAGERPFTGRDVMEVFLAARAADYTALVERVPGLDPGWSALVDAMLAPDPERRLGTVVEAAERVRALVGEAPEDALRKSAPMTAAARAVSPDISVPPPQGAPTPGTASEGAAAPTSDEPFHTPSSRYGVINELGSGSLGTVLRAVDRLTGETVALKRLKTSIAADEAERRALAREFAVQSSFRHQNLVGVLDYGFDHARQPFFTMPLIERAVPLDIAGQGLAESVRADLLVQLLRAIAYLHRRGVVHGDLKPSNVVVADGRVRVLDFGVALHAGTPPTSEVGALAWTAPEVLAGGRRNKASDLWAAGLLGYVLFGGPHPFARDSLAATTDAITTASPDEAVLECRDAVRTVLRGLLHKDPGQRTETASEALAAMSEALGTPLPIDTALSRESYLQGAELVGRGDELARLREALREARAARGGLVVVQGESGIGKSRLLQELRTEALVGGALVLRGQAVAEARRPYELWRDVVEVLALHVPLTDLDASVLVAVFPNLRRLVTAVQSAGALPAAAARDRLLSVLRRVLQSSDRPTVVLLEDLHWAGDESLAVLEALLDELQQSAMLVVCTWRTDERRALPDLLARAEVLELERLRSADIAALVAQMTGKREARVAELVERETEGNPFFIVEVVRALADDAGGLEQVGSVTLPSQVLPGGIGRIVQRYLDRVPDEDQALLRTLALAGREVELVLVQALGVEDPEAFARRCAQAALLTPLDDGWRFTHDKIREGLRAALPEADLAGTHRAIATALESLPAEQRTAAALAHHWGAAGDLEREGHWAACAGEEAFAASAHADAIALLATAVERSPGDDGESRRRRGRWQRMMGDSWLSLGRPEAAVELGASSLRTLRQPVPTGGLRAGLALAWEVWVQLAHRVAPRLFVGRLARRGDETLPIVRTYDRIGEAYFFRGETLPMLHAAFRTLNLSEAVGGATPELASSYGNLHSMTGLMQLHGVSRTYARWAFDAAESMGDEATTIKLLWMNTVYHLQNARWEEAKGQATRLVERARAIGDVRHWEMGTASMGLAALLRAEHDDAVQLCTASWRSAQRGDVQGQAWSILGVAEVHIRAGDLRKAAWAVDIAEGLLEDKPGPELEIWVRSARARLDLAAGRDDEAYEAAVAILAQAKAGPPLAYFVYWPYCTAMHVFLASAAADASAEARKMLKQLKGFARTFAIGAPIVPLYQGCVEVVAGRPDRARPLLEAAVERARAQQMPWEAGLATEALEALERGRARGH